MIHIIDEYYVTGGARDYTLLKDTHREDKNGNTVYKTLGYYGSVANAVEGLRKTLCRELTAEKNMELYEAVRAFKGIAEELEKATEGLR